MHNAQLCIGWLFYKIKNYFVIKLATLLSVDLLRLLNFIPETIQV